MTYMDCFKFMTQSGEGWVCEVDDEFVGFSIVYLKNHDIWDLFFKPEFENLGIGRKFHDIMLDWYFEQTRTNV